MNPTNLNEIDSAILALVCWVLPAKDFHQNYLAGWGQEIHGSLGKSISDAELIEAFNRLHTVGLIRITRPDQTHYHAFEYDGQNVECFYRLHGTDRFNAVATAKGTRFWADHKDAILAISKGVSH